MFPYSSIVQHYVDGWEKVKYITEFGISPYVNKLVKVDLENQLFTFPFGEVMTNQV